MRFLLWMKGWAALLFARRKDPPPPSVIDFMSIRARVALGCTCLEKLCLEWGLLSGKMPNLLTALRDFTSSDRLDQWDGRITALIPEAPSELLLVLDQESVAPQRLELLLEMLKAVHQIGGENLYSGFVSEFTRLPTERVLELLSKAEVPPPNLAPFVKSTVLECGGWGQPRPANFFREEGVA
jgi:hypothetical protein